MARRKSSPPITAASIRTAPVREAPYFSGDVPALAGTHEAIESARELLGADPPDRARVEQRRRVDGP